MSSAVYCAIEVDVFPEAALPLNSKELNPFEMCRDGATTRPVRVSVSQSVSQSVSLSVSHCSAAGFHRSINQRTDIRGAPPSLSDGITETPKYRDTNTLALSHGFPDWRDFANPTGMARSKPMGDARVKATKTTRPRTRQ